MRSMTIELPDKECNKCLFFHTYLGDQMGFRNYCCGYFGDRLRVDYKKIFNKNPGYPGDSPEHVAYPSDVCKKHAK